MILTFGVSVKWQRNQLDGTPGFVAHNSTEDCCYLTLREACFSGAKCCELGSKVSKAIAKHGGAHDS